MRYTEVKVISPKKGVNPRVYYFVGADYMCKFVRVTGIRFCQRFVPHASEYITRCNSIDETRSEYESINTEKLKYAV